MNKELVELNMVEITSIFGGGKIIWKYENGKWFKVNNQ